MEEVTQPLLEIGHYRLVFKPEAKIVSHPRQSFIWRGAFGNRLKEESCSVGAADCVGCMLKNACIYNYLFETPPPTGTKRMKLYPAAPHPYVLRVSECKEAEEEYHLEVVLVGRSNQHLPMVVRALKQVAKRGMASGLGNMASKNLQRWSFDEKCWVNADPKSFSATSLSIPPCPEEVLLQFDTPLRLKHPGRKGEKQRSVQPQQFAFHNLFRTLLNRISALNYFHMDKELQTDFAGLSRASELVPLKYSTLHWEDWRRYSSRQESNIPMGGIVGNIQINGEDLTPFWPYLWLGQWINAGKGASMGMGQYHLFSIHELG